ncbi:Putative membrane spanning protein (plasmid) [Borrelia crocidurae DOU]|uniref:Putative membrane spanning protein n=1 Tax=Borrelia crocidurae DOU TaxID=1293575 RepID=W5SK30_9SPIR|nr:virulence associated lipoprotein [Borrelia crocidurae]AHH07489.1 Putative membrane spanning protein [Borrelia crocidurae DOU]
MKQKDLIISIMFILINLLLMSCGSPRKYVSGGIVISNKTTPEQKKMQKEQKGQKGQKEIADIKREIPNKVMDILKIHYGKSWNEFAQIIEIGALGSRLATPNEIFNMFIMEDASKNILYTENVTLRNEFYLALEYDLNLMAPFIDIYYNIDNGFTFDASERALRCKSFMNKFKNNMIEQSRNYAKAYYIDVYEALKAKQNKLDILSLQDLKLLKTKLAKLESSKRELITGVIRKFVNDYNNDIATEFFIIQLEGELRIRAFDLYKVPPYFEEKFKNFEAKCSVVIALANEIKGILDKIKIN